MEKKLIGFGLLSGAVAGAVAFVVARVFAEPVIRSAVDYESRRAAVLGRDEGHEMFSRTVQGTLGLGVGLVLIGAAMGALVAVGYCVCVGRTGRVRPYPLAVLVPAFYFVGLFLVPFLKYPANPPAIGHEDTVRVRGALYLVTVAVSCLALFLAVYAGQALHRRYGLQTSALLAGAGYVGVVTVLFLVLPPVATETPLPLRDARGTILYPGFPADVLARFRMYAVAEQVVLWGVIALVFAPLARRARA